MLKRKIAGTLLTASILSLPAPAFADHIGEPVYNIHYYSDSSLTVEVGYDPGTCAYFGPSYGHTGQTTEHAVYDYLGHCYGGYWIELH